MSNIRYGWSILFILLVSISFIFTGCTGGIEGTGVDKGVNLKGTAAKGNALSFTKVVIKGGKGKKLETTTDREGKFIIEVSDLAPPYLLWIDLDNFYSVAFKSGVVNIHPLTDLVTKNWFAVRGYSLQAEFQSDKAVTILPTESEITAIKLKIDKILSLAEFWINNDFDFFNDPFFADQTGFDGFLDLIYLTISNSKINISVEDPKTKFRNKIIDNVSLSFDFTTSNIQPPCVETFPDTCISLSPTIPTGLRVVPSNINEFILAWKVSQDNSGIMGYNIYRNNELIDSTPYIAYIDNDTNLLNNTKYCYSVEAIDGDGNTSEKSLTQCSTTTVNPDFSLPAPILNLTATALGSNTTQLIWDASPESNVLGYTIYISDFDISQYIEKMTILDTSINLYIEDQPRSSNSICYYVEGSVYASITPSVDPAITPVNPINSDICTTIIPDVTAPVTVAIPATSTFVSTQSIHLNCDDLYNSGCAVTYYTLDNTPVDDFSSVYTGVISIRTTTTIRFLSIDMANNREQEKIETYTIK